MKIYEGGCIDTSFFLYYKKKFSLPPTTIPYPFLQVPPFHNYYMRNSLKRGGGGRPSFHFLIFFPAWPLAARPATAKNFKMKICGERGGFLNLSSWVPKGYPRGEGCPVTPPYL